MIAMLDGDAAAGACDPAVAVELVAKRTNVIGGVKRVDGGDEGIGVVVLLCGHFTNTCLCHRVFTISPYRVSVVASEA